MLRQLRMVRVFILGLPRTGTTFVYNYLCRAMKEVNPTLCIFEPFNYEVMNDIVSGVKHVHDTEGEIIYDYGKLPNELLQLIYQNSLWHKEWMEVVKPAKPFLGNDYIKILNTLNVLPHNILIKDGHAWVKAEELVNIFKNMKFIFTHPPLEVFVEKVVKRFKLFKNPLDKAGFTKFYRYFTSGMYFKEASEYTAVLEGKAIYVMYTNILHNIKNMDNVFIISYTNKISKETLNNVIKWVYYE